MLNESLIHQFSLLHSLEQLEMHSLRNEAFMTFMLNLLSDENEERGDNEDAFILHLQGLIKDVSGEEIKMPGPSAVGKAATAARILGNLRERSTPVDEQRTSATQPRIEGMDVDSSSGAEEAPAAPKESPAAEEPPALDTSHWARRDAEYVRGVWKETVKQIKLVRNVQRAIQSMLDDIDVEELKDILDNCKTESGVYEFTGDEEAIDGLCCVARRWFLAMSAIVS